MIFSEVAAERDSITNYCKRLIIAGITVPSTDTFSSEVIPWAQTTDATVDPGVFIKCEYYLELVEEASKHRELHTSQVGDRNCMVYPNKADKLKAKRVTDRYALSFLLYLVNVCIM